MNKKDKKKNYMEKLKSLIEMYPKFLLISGNNVGANQLSSIRGALRGRGEILMGKNSLMRRAFSQVAETRPEYTIVRPHITGNLGLLFTNEDPKSIIETLNEHRLAAEAKKGALSPCDVIIPKGGTGIEPTKTQFFQALEISTKITRGCIDVIGAKKIISKGDKVGTSEANILKMLNIKPFQYGVEVIKIYDEGSVYGPEILNMTDGDLFRLFSAGVQNVAALSLALGLLNEASLPHVFTNAYRNVLSVPIATEFKYTFPEAAEIEEFIKDPSKFAAPVVEEKKEEEEAVEEEEDDEESEEEGLGLGLFGGGSDSDDSDDDSD